MLCLTLFIAAFVYNFGTTLHPWYSTTNYSAYVAEV